MMEYTQFTLQGPLAGKMVLISPETGMLRLYILHRRGCTSEVWYHWYPAASYSSMEESPGRGSSIRENRDWRKHK